MFLGGGEYPKKRVTQGEGKKGLKTPLGTRKCIANLAQRLGGGGKSKKKNQRWGGKLIGVPRPSRENLCKPFWDGENQKEKGGKTEKGGKKERRKNSRCQGDLEPGPSYALKGKKKKKDE